MAEPFKRREGAGGSIFGRLFAGRARSSAAREIEDLLARAPRVSDVSPAQIAEVAARHGIDLEQRLRTPRLSLYRRFLEHCLLDGVVSASEFEDLAHLRALLRLSDAEVIPLHEEVACSVYGRAIDEVLQDQRLDPEEEAFLRRLRKELDLGEDVADRLYSEGAERARRRFLDRAVSRDDFLLSSRDITLDLSGSSDEALEQAIHGTVDEASRAVPDLRWVEVDRIGAEVDGGKVARWHIKLKGRRTAKE